MSAITDCNEKCSKASVKKVENNSYIYLHLPEIKFYGNTFLNLVTSDINVVRKAKMHKTFFCRTKKYLIESKHKNKTFSFKWKKSKILLK